MDLPDDKPGLRAVIEAAHAKLEALAKAKESDERANILSVLRTIQWDMSRITPYTCEEYVPTTIVSHQLSQTNAEIFEDWSHQTLVDNNDTWTVAVKNHGRPHSVTATLEYIPLDPSGDGVIGDFHLMINSINRLGFRVDYQSCIDSVAKFQEDITGIAVHLKEAQNEQKS